GVQLDQWTDNGGANQKFTVNIVGSSGGGSGNIAPNGTAYGWFGMSSSTGTANQTAQPGLNDNNLTANVDLEPAGGAIGAWEAGGVIWSSPVTISSADFINGDITTGGDGFLTANLKLQFTTDGTAWTDSGWTASPAYPYSSSAGGQTYAFSGTAVSGVLGARVVGQVRTTDTSYHWILKEVQFTGSSGGGGTPDFSLSASPNSLTITQGANGTSTISVNPVNGYNNTVSLSASGLPSGVTASFNPGSTTSGSTLTLTASATAATGSTTVTISGTDGTLTHTTTISLTVAASGGGGGFSGIYQIQNEASGLVLNNQGSLTNGSAITQWKSVSSSNLDWQFFPTSNGYYQINSCKSALDAVVKGASTAQGAGIIQWSFGSSGNDQWQSQQNGDGSYTFVNLHSGLVLEDPGSSTSTSAQMDQWGANGGANQMWKLLAQ
ncbi:MAG: RICIN domain-containing protein, partial [Verrucomicrobia bacterium]|nr:RICIN domain-containing protein [Verrucomicrobiota bacterium]